MAKYYRRGDYIINLDNVLYVKKDGECLHFSNGHEEIFFQADTQSEVNMEFNEVEKLFKGGN